ncbi:ferric reductase-like transmembrane domain-containing protein [Bacillus benzoevorans]|uniref:DMSO/TMAO reductase YedYZ heme-binding membrane subunit n=1 Tax=Bacillus benzoevorans TaxID=1456 RepID=A0A7X0HMP4_9BACI|nr:ferric reductase-like transmembrane domain-containing protein [Bacillus benzoevorans]MBB6443648.1 DMSO/TMAO reductase YedYZ heme-binding membrane subunit [Bacillus benzoevorans]
MNELLTVWNFIRLSGLLAYLLLTISVIGGIVSSWSILKKKKGDLLALHQMSGWAGFLSILFHLMFIWQDNYVDYTLSEILLPFADNEFPFASGIGVIAFYLFFLVLFSSDFMLKRLGKARWKWIHISVFPAWILMTLHGILIGTDSSETWVRLLYAASISLVLLLLTARLLTSRNKRHETGHQKKTMMKTIPLEEK